MLDRLRALVAEEASEERAQRGLNRLFKDWPKVFPDALNAQVIAERLTERAEHFILDGKGYRPTKHST